ncbi:conserved hypothetical protein [Leptospira interrogans serovar Copenhageni str. Fiocruz L1-130]|uniref:Uncharacterized protein n=1 Tax=Leptospira interrogans serogroup Icterohaemorrhagiae serovar copenhageni (strain Fiocruz L1-130) TaxID=267671 RepID=Q72UP3_LEPIC|nr:conserved hypothetical protein [Leptospira interrogans serovar Copenhageni str. Fiocruz L1-130]
MFYFFRKIQSVADGPKTVSIRVEGIFFISRYYEKGRFFPRKYYDSKKCDSNFRTFVKTSKKQNDPFSSKNIR